MRQVIISDVTATVWQDELTFGVDLDGDGYIGLVPIEDNGSVSLNMVTTYNGGPQYYFVDGSGDRIGLTRGGALVRPGASSVWNATQVEESAERLDLKCFGLGPDGNTASVEH